MSDEYEYPSECDHDDDVMCTHTFFDRSMTMYLASRRLLKLLKARTHWIVAVTPECRSYAYRLAALHQQRCGGEMATLCLHDIKLAPSLCTLPKDQVSYDDLIGVIGRIEGESREVVEGRAWILLTSQDTNLGMAAIDRWIQTDNLLNQRRSRVMPQASETATPAALEAERTLLGAVLLDDQQMVHVADVLPPTGGQWFYHKANHLIYDAMLTLFERHEPIDLVSLIDVLMRRGQLEKVGGSVYLASLSDGILTTRNVAYHARLVRDKALLRSVINISTEMQASAYEQDDLQDIVGQANQALLGIANAQATSSFARMDALVRGSIAECEHAQQHEPVGIPTGFHELDYYLYGFQPTDLIIVAARPGMGKTSLGLQFAVTAARHPPRLPVAVFSLEMSKQQLSMRLVCAEARIDSQRVRRGFLSPQESGQFYAGAERLYELPILVDDTPSVSVLDIRARCKRLQAEGGLGMVVVDYLQLRSCCKTLSEVS
jgi:replicative DNA helicase